MDRRFRYGLLMAFTLLGHCSMVHGNQLWIPLAADVGRQVQSPSDPTGPGFREVSMGVDGVVGLTRGRVEPHVGFQCLRDRTV